MISHPTHSKALIPEEYFHNITQAYLLIQLIIVIIVFVVSCKEQTNNSSNRFLPISTPEEQGIDSKLLADMLQKVKKEELRIRSIIIIKNEHLVLECYVHPYNENVLHDIKSVGKSIISSLVGITLKEKIIDSLNQKVFDFIPEYFPADPDLLKKEITLAHLITMSTGLELDENGPIMSEIMSKDDWIKATFEQPMNSVPGEQFTYSTLLTHTMSIILTETSGTGLLELSNKYLFEPIGVNQIYWEKGANGYYFGGDKLWLTPRAMAKFGYLFLKNGRWDDTQIIPKEWIKESTKNNFVEFNDSGYIGYGYWWWLGEDGSYHARGFGGQIISVYPELDMVVIFTGADNFTWQQLTNEYILPAISKEKSIVANSADQKRMNKVIRKLKSKK
jgi:CubicO group peptidase (beta-lactamase class C family)